MTKFADFKRVIVWAWRILNSSYREIGGSAAPSDVLWVYDTLNEPDGAILFPFVESVVQKMGINCGIFGPDKMNAWARTLGLLYLVRWLPCLLLNAGDVDSLLKRMLRDRFERLLLCGRVKVILVGSCRGTFARHSIDILSPSEIWEVQHGLTDKSYFPVVASTFFARSSHSASIISSQCNSVRVILLGKDLDPPAGYIDALPLEAFCEVGCYSKNPGGGCSADELASFELACKALAAKLGVPFYYFPHPRDSLFKRIIRHRNFFPLIWMRGGRHTAISNGPKLMISSFSTALVSNSVTGNCLLNVRIRPDQSFDTREYDWLPTLNVSDLVYSSGELRVFIRA